MKGKKWNTIDYVNALINKHEIFLHCKQKKKKRGMSYTYVVFKKMNKIKEI